ncbi:phosphatase PAP2 family protein [Paenibacillus hexagrammi]|uniref:Phosphatase PAP2 family protein n=1 Tax=Paenibacillus hexagrammi TaxID=2908839 RepID=A0ABY3SM24_9BACL|nr:phosphatase PAP2 family protein [Paenibacillus sp. YPD9-1]UJF34126.1 phosphatase PAP2 family protein [Paenibacillus sp. YPD9-1]
MQERRIYRDLLVGLSAALLMLLIFGWLSQSLSSSWLENLDQSVAALIQSARGDHMTGIAKLFTLMGEGVTEFILFFIIGPVLYFKFRHRWETLILFIGVLGTWGLNSLVKGWIERDRPAGTWLIEEEGFSFPSGHSMVSSLFYGLVGYLLWVNLRERWSGAWILPIVSMLLILGIGCSRVYLGVHYPSDVLAGFIAGGACLTGCILAVREVRHRREWREASKS